MCITALAALSIETIDRMDFLDLHEVADLYNFSDEVKHLSLPHQVDELRQKVKAKANQHKTEAYASVWTE
ncbi:MAG: hypothetical protein Q8P73_04555 [bacterium]|nr:hypothetical protein [bacterium]